MDCPVCHKTEIYKTRISRDYFGNEDVVVSSLVIKGGKYDDPEPGQYECVDGHEFEITEEPY